MPKRKLFSEGSQKKSKHAPQQPTTPDDYLAVGVEFEEAGEKWRGGDALKSTRFFLKALDAYDEALRKFPSSPDIAYNKARLQYDLTQHPKIVVHLPGSPLELLNTALDSSRYALASQPDNPDVLFNTAQVLTSRAELMLVPQELEGEIMDSLREALHFLETCLALQHQRYVESKALDAAVLSRPPDHIEDVSYLQDDNLHASVTVGEQWASIVEPVTKDTILDTLLTQLQILSLIVTASAESAEGIILPYVEGCAGKILSDLPTYLIDESRHAEASLARGYFLTAFADANFRSGRIQAQNYRNILTDAYSGSNMVSNPRVLCSRAEALIVYNLSMRLHNHSENAASMWEALTSALENLAAASQLPDAEDVFRIHLLQGDVELLRYQLGQPPSTLEIAIKNERTLLKNAQTFYRGSAAQARVLGAEKDSTVATVKEALAAAMDGDATSLKDMMKGCSEQVLEILEDSSDAGLVSMDWIHSLSNS